MDVTAVEIQPVEFSDSEPLHAFASVVFDDEFVVHNIRLIDTEDRILVAMPNERHAGSFRDIAHPLNSEFRATIRRALVRRYNRMVGSHRELPMKDD